jgi:anaerobic selenocysteine-containing dehydrogenase
MTETARLADVVLPATTFVEQSDVYKSYGHRLAQYGRKAVDAPHEQRSNVEAFAALARALGLPQEVWDVSEDSLCREVLDAARERIGEVDLQRILAGEPVKLRPREFPDRGTPSGKIELWSEAARALGEPPMATWVAEDGSGGKGRFNLIAAPSKATHNTTFTGSSRHVQRAGRPLCLVNPSDADKLGVAAGDTVRLRNEQGTITLEAELSGDMPPGMLRVDGFPRPDQLPEGVGINALASPELTDLGESNVLYSTRVDLEKCEPTGSC